MRLCAGNETDSQAVQGKSDTPANLFANTEQLSIPFTQKIKVMNSADVYSVMQQILLRESKIERDYERLYVVGLAANNRIIYIESVSLGAINHTVVEPMQVFRVGILKGAVQ